jgi:hypothetical protein
MEARVVAWVMLPGVRLFFGNTSDVPMKTNRYGGTSYF